jgi:hypothetical protein
MAEVAVQVVDANLAPIVEAHVAMPGTTFHAIADKSGSAKLPLSPQQALKLNVSHPYYVTEDVEFEPDVRSGNWNNGLVKRQLVNEDVVLTVQLGRCITAPTSFVEASEIARLVQANDSQAKEFKAALLFKPPAFPDQFAYRFQWYNASSIRIAGGDLLPTTAPNDNQKGWDRFQTDTASDVQVANNGRFFWLMYPQQPTERQYVVAIWSPNVLSDTTLETLDMVVYFSPNTSSYEGIYPFGLVGGKGEGVADQPYMTLGKKYLLDEYYFAPEMTARRNPSVLVMPICRQGDWGPFATGGGLLRLLREVAVFLQRECRTSSLGVKQTAYDPAYRLAGASLRSSTTEIRGADFGDTPTVGKVAVAFFSTGALPAKQVMSRWGVGSGLVEQYWGAPRGQGQDPSAAWSTSWRELWDMDGFHPATGGWGNYLQLLQKWYDQNATKVIRLCHSSGRVPPNPLTDTNPIWKELLKQGITLQRDVAASGSFGTARELHGERWSVVAFSDAYVANGADDVLPVLGDAHHATAKVAFSHSSALTSVGVRQPISFQRN